MSRGTLISRSRRKEKSHDIPLSLANMKNIKGAKFGRLLVIRVSGHDKHGRITWDCVCDCGRHLTLAGFKMTSARVRSCGCLQKEAAAKLCVAKTTHGLGTSKIYGVWLKMLQRCEDTTCKAWPNYGGRGIKVCDRWR